MAFEANARSRSSPFTSWSRLGFIGILTFTIVHALLLCLFVELTFLDYAVLRKPRTMD